MTFRGAPGETLAPLCVTCSRRHLTDLPCWVLPYRAAVTAALFATVPPRRPCWICGKDGATTADHVKPRSRGGTDALDNLRPAHAPCNAARGNREAFDPIPDTVPDPIPPRWRILTQRNGTE